MDNESNTSKREKHLDKINRLNNFESSKNSNFCIKNNNPQTSYTP